MEKLVMELLQKFCQICSCCTRLSQDMFYSLWLFWFKSLALQLTQNYAKAGSKKILRQNCQHFLFIHPLNNLLFNNCAYPVGLFLLKNIYLLGWGVAKWGKHLSSTCKALRSIPGGKGVEHMHTHNTHTHTKYTETNF